MPPVGLRREPPPGQRAFSPSAGPAAPRRGGDSRSRGRPWSAFRSARDRVGDLLRRADVVLDGDRPWDLRVHDDRMFSRVVLGGSLALGESYMDGWWDSERLDESFYRILRAGLEGSVRPWVEPLRALSAGLFNLQKPSRAFQVGERHYDVGNDLYRWMLGERMIYSCGYWRNASTLEEAQEAKLDLVCRKLRLQPGMRILDIGCGWGGAAKFAAERYGVSVVGITISREQFELARTTCEDLDIEIRLQDYRDLAGEFDGIFSIGMFEHVGRKNYDRFFSIARRHLKEDGLFLLHTIGGNRSVNRTEPWIERHIFPNSMLPSVAQICEAAEGEFVLEDWQNFGPDYDPTLMCWYENFQEHWPVLKDRYDERFYRMWKYYLLSCAGSFRARKNQVWQIVFSPRGMARTYTPIR
ncbi:MAG: cyclopropane fatty acyl phospholipid synthase [Gemmatimonadota bacterium]|nr:MAG: cyclopropane fatty acyl phospholipid synthase [Gemmatimonadota bacterium]